jgi:3-deoxy-manno-octulosonate cytidylyltransferase (CMP-KDO synthetase)
MKVLFVIPSRLGSTRLPQKPLLPIHGKPLVAHVLERAREATGAPQVVVATDSTQIAAAVESAGGRVVMTDPALPSGTDRVAAVARLDPTLADDDLVVNFQGDQPLLPGQALAALVSRMQRQPDCPMGTLVCPLPADELTQPSVAKVVCSRDGYALYFSRASIPFVRDPQDAGAVPYAAHVGVYAYRKRALLQLADTPPCPLERAEMLEQLRALWLGMRILTVPLRSLAPFEINTPEDHARAQALWARANGDGAQAYRLWCQDAAHRTMCPFPDLPS